MDENIPASGKCHPSVYINRQLNDQLCTFLLSVSFTPKGLKFSKWFSLSQIIKISVHHFYRVMTFSCQMWFFPPSVFYLLGFLTMCIEDKRIKMDQCEILLVLANSTWAIFYLFI